MTGQPQTRYSSKLLPMNILTLIQVPARPFHGGLTDHNNNLHLRFPTFPRPRSRFYHFFSKQPVVQFWIYLACNCTTDWHPPSPLRRRRQHWPWRVPRASERAPENPPREQMRNPASGFFILAGGGLSKDSHCEVAFPARLRSSIRSQVVFCASHHPLPYLFHISPSSSISTKYLAIVWEFQLASRD